ncbi:AI-2E family transporter [Propionimicrobium sp. PCR01-08-3]|uniref:AI-2E family transporter n=1 Tax=Propionimicrobium sp. PCR01-08-3 TaxID=3052086 RepID=UPI00255C7D61|nr:AI-2E family transporter [Propionimicrobium sp. PCR01-08-3]WIY81869.1 AI-2E family transporter [Propionimicrobium sp. PCR01-08-3]
MTATPGATPVPSPTSGTSQSDDIFFTPKWLRIGASWGWRLLVLAAVTVVLWQIGAKMSQIVVPLILALLFTSGLGGFCEWLVSKGWPRWAGSITALLAFLLVIAGLLVVVGAQVALQWSQLANAATQGVEGLLNWLASGPLHVSASQVNDLIDKIVSYVQDSAQNIATGVAGGLASAGSTIGSLFAGLATCLFATFFFLKDGSRITGTAREIVPTHAMGAMEPSLRGGWASLSSYVKAAVIVAGVDGVGAGLGALLLGSNLWLAITAFTFVCSFVPLLGAIVAGAVATLVVLVTLGFTKAVIMLIVFVGVMTLESHVLQPLVLGKAVEIHPLIVLLGISAGAIVAGISGALFAIPLVAFISGCIRGQKLLDQEAERKQKKAEARAARQGRSRVKSSDREQES